jgi:hypothetical protein
MPQIESNQAYIVSLEPYSRAFFILPYPVLASLERELCGSVLVIKALHYFVTGPDARPRLNSATPVLGNLTSLEVGTLCNNEMKMVRNG